MLDRAVHRGGAGTCRLILLEDRRAATGQSDGLHVFVPGHLDLHRIEVNVVGSLVEGAGNTYAVKLSRKGGNVGFQRQGVQAHAGCGGLHLVVFAVDGKHHRSDGSLDVVQIGLDRVGVVRRGAGTGRCKVSFRNGQLVLSDLAVVGHCDRSQNDVAVRAKRRVDDLAGLIHLGFRRGQRSGRSSAVSVETVSGDLPSEEKVFARRHVIGNGKRRALKSVVQSTV